MDFHIDIILNIWFFSSLTDDTKIGICFETILFTGLISNTENRSTRVNNKSYTGILRVW